MYIRNAIVEPETIGWEGTVVSTYCGKPEKASVAK
jgi:hypothetical protein